MSSGLDLWLNLASKYDTDNTEYVLAFGSPINIVKTCLKSVRSRACEF